MPVHSIRLAREEDGLEITRLADQLGYPSSSNEMRRRLQRLLASPNDLVLVAEVHPGVLVGWVHAFLSQLLESDYRVEIGGLVVDQEFRRGGVGRELVHRVEQWASGRGVAHVSVRCRTTRADAHRFYENLGFSPAKTQTVFRKTLN